MEVSGPCRCSCNLQAADAFGKAAGSAGGAGGGGSHLYPKAGHERTRDLASCAFTSGCCYQLFTSGGAPGSAAADWHLRRIGSCFGCGPILAVAVAVAVAHTFFGGRIRLMCRLDQRSSSIPSPPLRCGQHSLWRQGTLPITKECELDVHPQAKSAFSPRVDLATPRGLGVRCTTTSSCSPTSQQSATGRLGKH